MNNRLQKKCVIAATSFHVLLLVTLLFGSAFFTSKEQPRGRELQMVMVMPHIVTDIPVVTGGDPEVQPPPPTPPQPTPPTPTPPQPAPPQPTQKETIEKPETKPENTKRSSDSLEASDKKPRGPQIDTRVHKGDTKQKQKQKAPINPANDSKARETKEAFNSAIQSLQKNLSTSTKVGIPGPGGAPFLSAGYENVLQSIYQSNYDVERGDGTDLGDGQVEVSVTVARDGTVKSSRVTKPSRNAALNKVVQRVLNRVTFIRQFPAGATDLERTFTIVFDLKPNKALG
jgi:TonB family protein